MLRGDLYDVWVKDDDNWGLAIISGDYSGVILQLQKIDFLDENTGELIVDYHIINKPEDAGDVEQQDAFKAVMEIIINDILKEAIENFANEQNRNNDSQEPDTQ